MSLSITDLQINTGIPTETSSSSSSSSNASDQKLVKWAPNDNAVMTVYDITHLPYELCHIILIYEATQINDLIRQELLHAGSCSKGTLSASAGLTELDLSHIPCGDTAISDIIDDCSGGNSSEEDVNFVRYVLPRHRFQGFNKLFIQLTALQRLNMSHCAMDDTVLEAISVACPLLTYLDLSGNKVLTKHAAHNYLPRFTRLRELSLCAIYTQEDDDAASNCFFSPGFKNSCKSLMQITSLKILDISGNSFGLYAFPQQFIALVRGLERLILNKGTVTKEELVTPEDIQQLKSHAPETEIVSDVV